MKAIALLAVLTLVACGKKENSTGNPDSGGSSTAAAVTVANYDASRDAAADMKNALITARQTHKRVLIETGSKSCEPCKAMDAFYAAHSELPALRDKNYIVVKVHVESASAVPAALSRFPAAARFPHLYVLDENGSLIQSQDTKELEKGGAYDLEKFRFFLGACGPPKA